MTDGLRSNSNKNICYGIINNYSTDAEQERMHFFSEKIEAHCTGLIGACSAVNTVIASDTVSAGYLFNLRDFYLHGTRLIAFPATDACVIVSFDGCNGEKAIDEIVRPFLVTEIFAKKTRHQQRHQKDKIFFRTDVERGKKSRFVNHHMIPEEIIDPFGNDHKDKPGKEEVFSFFSPFIDVSNGLSARTINLSEGLAGADIFLSSRIME